MMAAAAAAGGAPEVIAQLENAAKVLMVGRPAPPLPFPFPSPPSPSSLRRAGAPSARGSARGALPAAPSRAGARRGPGRSASGVLLAPEGARHPGGSAVLPGEARRCAAGAGLRAAAG